MALRSPLPHLILLLMALAPAGAVPPPPESFDGETIRCDPAGSAATVLICRDRELTLLDGEVRRLFRLAAQAGGRSPGQETPLTAEQRRWVEQRDICWRSATRATWDADLRQCVLDSTVTRIHQLRQGNPAARSQDGKGSSTGPLAVVCPGIDPPIALTLVRGDPGHVLLAWPDRSLVLTRVRSGSGARYTRRDRQGFTLVWIKGSDLRLELPGRGQARICRVAQREPVPSRDLDQPVPTPSPADG